MKCQSTFLVGLRPALCVFEPASQEKFFPCSEQTINVSDQDAEFGDLRFEECRILRVIARIDHGFDAL